MCDSSTEALNNLILHRALLPNCAQLTAEHMAVGPTSRMTVETFLRELRGGPMPAPRVQTVKLALAALGHLTLTNLSPQDPELPEALERWLNGQRVKNGQEAAQPSLFSSNGPVQAPLFAA